MEHLWKDSQEALKARQAEWESERSALYQELARLRLALKSAGVDAVVAPPLPPSNLAAALSPPGHRAAELRAAPAPSATDDNEPPKPTGESDEPGGVHEGGNSTAGVSQTHAASSAAATAGTANGDPGSEAAAVVATLDVTDPVHARELQASLLQPQGGPSSTTLAKRAAGFPVEDESSATNMVKTESAGFARSDVKGMSISSISSSMTSSIGRRLSLGRRPSREQID